MIEQVGLALSTFALTNLDDLLLLTLYFANPAFKIREIVIGQYLGVLALVALSLLGLILGEFVSQQWIGLLGVIPIFLGIKGIYQLLDKRSDQGEGEPQVLPSPMYQGTWGGIFSIAVVTLANGGDNIGVYTPLFATLKFSYLMLYLVIFVVLIGVWCGLGYYLVQHRRVAELLAKYGHLILPVFLILLGLLILLEAKSFTLLTN